MKDLIDRQEALDRLRHHKDYIGSETGSIAIIRLMPSAAEMDEDAISRKEAKKAYCRNFCHPGVLCPDNLCVEVHKAFDSIPSVHTCAPETNADNISRQAAIDSMYKLCELNKGNDYEENPHIDAIVDELDRVPSVQPEQQWIPCSERLPEDIKPVIVTWKNNDPASYYQYIVGKHYIGTAHYKNNKWYWYSSVTEDLLAEYGRCESEEFDEAIEVVAWRPLPEPYKEGE